MTGIEVEMDVQLEEAKTCLLLFWEEHMAGGFAENALTDEAKSLFSEVEGYMMNDIDIPETLIRRWVALTHE